MKRRGTLPGELDSVHGSVPLCQQPLDLVFLDLILLEQISNDIFFCSADGALSDL
jgi:hypothetical protein